ncbi:DUF1206 domain-containing protein [Sphingomonas sinipercae]|uniref:DUF1206 domain-containing protein n=1 Tax=Sphingomonas sinipercae TaxID=2714944 RepID=A0A6G7ZLI4_9SPHN|nr:DUF1206 domain-containing protein [Sphingomonas sinipercae]QIL01785.1 DUF1206 domain-containing protein [Sphingomonas sinipercae]
MSPDAPIERAKELARESNFLSLCRIGFLGRGVLYILIAFLALRTGRTEDLTGALTYLNEGVGRVLLIVIAAGLSAYGLWRLADAAFGIEHPGGDAKAMRKRAAAGGIGLIYLYLAYKAARILLAGEAGEMSAAEQADTVLDLPGGALVLGLAALGLAAGGLNQIRKAWICTFLRNLDHRGRAPFVLWLGRIGYTARGVIFLTIAYLIGHAALDGETDEVGGMEEALDFFSGPVLYAVALGLLLFGVFSLIEAVFRQMHEPPSADAIKRDVQAKVGS